MTAVAVGGEIDIKHLRECVGTKVSPELLWWAAQVPFVKPPQIMSIKFILNKANFNAYIIGGWSGKGQYP